MRIAEITTFTYICYTFLTTPYPHSFVNTVKYSYFTADFLLGACA